MTTKSYTSARFFFLVISIVFSTGIYIQRAAAQTVAIGHITAEVVESVSASSNVVMNFNISNVREGSNYISVNSSTNNTRKLDMGEIAIHSGSSIACNVMMKNATLTDDRGNKFVVEPETAMSGQQDVNRADGSQKLHVTGTAMLAQVQANGLYQGSYTMVFAYN
jgi:hypothetical protein